MSDDLDSYERAVQQEHEASLLKQGLMQGYSWLPPLMNFNFEDTVFCWFRLKFGYSRVEPFLIKSSLPVAGPKWLEDEDDSLASILEHGFYSERSWVEWGIQNGISPGQPFLIGFLKPVWSRTSYEYDEWDADYHWELIRALPCKQTSAGKAWEKALKRMSAIRAKKERHAEHIRRLSLALRHRWKIEVQHLGSMEHPRVQLRLFCSSKETHSHSIAYGEAGGRLWAQGYELEPDDKNLAFSRLVSNFVQNHPEEDATRLFDLASTVGAVVPLLDRLLYSSSV